MIEKIGRRGYLLIGVLIFAASSSISSKLIEIGGENLIDGRNPVSFCNILLVGNICGLIGLSIVYGREWRAGSLRGLKIGDWISVIAVGILSGALAPALTFIALEETTVNNVILISRIGPPLTLLLSYIFLKARINKEIIGGGILAFIGVILIITLQENSNNIGGGIRIGKGEILVMVAAIAGAIGNTISAAKLKRIPLGIFTIFRTGLGTVIFLGLTLKLYGAEHFMDVFSPFIWKWMLVYGIVIVALGQVVWFKGLKESSAAEVSLISSVSPIAGILGSFIILGEVPQIEHYIGGGVIMLGILLNQKGINSKNRDIKKIDTEIGFKGI